MMKLRIFTSIKPLLASLFLLLMSFIVNIAFAQSSPEGTVGAVADNIIGSMRNVGLLVVAIAYIGGFSFACAALFKFKALRDSPGQNSIMGPIALLAAAVFLVFLPTLISSGGQTIFGSDKTTGGFEGQGINILSMPSSSS